MLTNIDITKISGHPDNPRKDLGDLTELAASIKQSGILQNLTVVPWFSSVTRAPADDNKMDGYYVAVIGHRRLAAAKLAGLTEVPCVIADMDAKTQVSTMILENMQRNDLTLREQAQGFQMMLDMGETISNISQKTGLSESTVRNRTKLLDLEDDKFKAAVERGATLLDFAQLDKISDRDLKNSVLEQVGTSNFNYTLQSALDKEKSERNKAALLSVLDRFAEKIESSVGYEYARFVDFSEKDFQVPEDSKEKQYYYIQSRSYVQLYTKSEQVDNSTMVTAADEERRKLNERVTQLSEISKRAFHLRCDFVKNLSTAKAKKNARAIMEFNVRNAINSEGYSLDEDMLMELLGFELGEDEEFSFDTLSETFALSPERVLLLTTYCNDADDCRWAYHSRQWGEYVGDQNLDEIYSFLTKLGYEMSDEEKALSDGSHELYVSTDKEV